MVSVSSPKFPTYTTQQTRLYNLLAVHRPKIRLQIDGESLELIFAEGSDADAAPHGLEFIATGVRLWIVPEESLFRQLTTPWLGNEELDGLPEVLREAVLIASLQPLLEQLKLITGSALSLVRGNSPPSEQALGVGLWAAQAAQSTPAATLWLDNNAVETFVATLQRMPCANNENDWSGLPTRLSILAGQTHLRVRELRDLEPNDLVLLPRGSVADTLLVMLQSSQQPLATARLNDGILTIDRLLETSMNENDPSGDGRSPQPDTDPENLEIRLDFDLGQVTVSLGELKKIQPGYSFELDMPVSGSVRILSGGRLIGHGQLVQIEDRLGVRVTELFNAGDD